MSAPNIITDFAIYTGYDWFKGKKMPDVTDMVENGLVAVSYDVLIYGLAKSMLEPILTFIPVQQYRDMLIEYVVKSALLYIAKMGLGSNPDFKSVMIKQLVSQSIKEVYKVLMTGSGIPK